MAKSLDLKAAVTAGIIAGILFIMLEMAMVAGLQGESPWAPPRMMAAMVMGESVLPPPGTFDLTIMMVAMMIHLVLSAILGVVLGLIISKLSLGLAASITVGTLFGVVIYYINFYGFTALFPWFAMARGAISLFAHAMFGLVLGGVYYALVSRHVRDRDERRSESFHASV